MSNQFFPSPSCAPAAPPPRSPARNTLCRSVTQRAQSLTSISRCSSLVPPSVPLFQPSGGKSALEVAKSVGDIVTGRVDPSHSALCPSIIRGRGVVVRQEFELPLRLADAKGFPIASR